MRALSLAMLLVLSPPAWGYTDQQLARQQFLHSVEWAHESELDRLLAIPADRPFSRPLLVNLGVTPARLAAWQDAARRMPIPDWVQKALQSADKALRRNHPVPAIAQIDPERYQQAVRFLSGETADPFGIRPGWRVTNRLMGHPHNQLPELEDYLVRYYQRLGLSVTKQPFDWQGQRYHNVVVTLPGQSPERVVLADHIDVAARYDVEEDTYRQAKSFGLTPEEVGRQRGRILTGDAVPGADDNASATAALMEAAHVLKGRRLEKTIQLVHLNGEEFPGDCLGARHFAAEALRAESPVAAVVVMDMIGVNRLGTGLFQLNSGLHPLSIQLADLALQAAPKAARGYRPVVRLLDDPKSYLYNTDGQIFSAAGFPTLLVNEQVNHDQELERLGYHDEFDLPRLMDFNYAVALAQVGISTGLAAAMAPAWQPVVLEARPAIQSSGGLLAHFKVELMHSALAHEITPTCGRQRSAWVEAVVRDRNRAPDDSVVTRILNWFPEGRFNRTDELAIADELEFLLCPEPAP